MPRKHRSYHPEYPIHVSARSNNKEHFPIYIQNVWEILTAYVFLLNKGFQLEILSFVLMSNHFHMLCRDPHGNLSDGMEHFMRESSRAIGKESGRINKIWGGPFHSSIISSELYFYHAYKYVYRNPVRAGLCQRVEDYPFSSMAMLLGRKHSILPLSYDHVLFDNQMGGVLDWLNQDYQQIENESLKSAINKKEFRLRKSPENKNPLDLEDWSSLPFAPHDKRSG